MIWLVTAAKGASSHAVSASTISRQPCANSGPRSGCRGGSVCDTTKTWPKKIYINALTGIILRKRLALAENLLSRNMEANLSNIMVLIMTLHNKVSVDVRSSQFRIWLFVRAALASNVHDLGQPNIHSSRYMLENLRTVHRLGIFSNQMSRCMALQMVNSFMYINSFMVCRTTRAGAEIEKTNTQPNMRLKAFIMNMRAIIWASNLAGSFTTSTSAQQQEAQQQRRVTRQTSVPFHRHHHRQWIFCRCPWDPLENHQRIQQQKSLPICSPPGALVVHPPGNQILGGGIRGLMLSIGPQLRGPPHLGRWAGKHPARQTLGKPMSG